MFNEKNKSLDEIIFTRLLVKIALNESTDSSFWKLL